MTTSLQYSLTVTNGVVDTETGHFFKAGPFTITIEERMYTIDFTHKEEGKVYYVISHNDKEICRLIHPDYVPESDFDSLNDTLNCADAQTLFYACCKAGVSIKKDYLEWIDRQSELPFSYTLSQPAFL